MGEMAEMMINGALCEHCGSFLDGDEPGYTRLCSDCLKESRRKQNIERSYQKKTRKEPLRKRKNPPRQR